VYGGSLIVVNIELNQERINETLFRFLQSVYLFEKREATLFSVSWDEVYLLQLLARKNPMTVTELAKKLKVKNFTASRMITRLADQKLVLRKQSTEDRRVMEIFLTTQGRNKIQEIEVFNYKTILANIDTLGENEVQILMNSIENLDILLSLKNIRGENDEFGE
jgi:DNA-binding MarR family transcriptional regulator